MLGCRVDGNPGQLVYSSTSQLVYSLTGKLTKHTTPLSPWRGAGGEALLSSFVEGLGVRLYSPPLFRGWAGGEALLSSFV